MAKEAEDAELRLEDYVHIPDRDVLGLIGGPGIKEAGEGGPAVPDREDANNDSQPLYKSSATGIPDRNDFGHNEIFSPGALLSFTDQLHEAQRAGTHTDKRFYVDSDQNKSSLYSYALRKGTPKPGEKHLAVQQPLHAHSYKDFEGTLSGYGQGTVRRADRGRLLVTRVTPDAIHYTRADTRFPERYALIKPKGGRERDWLLINTTPTKPLPYGKLHYKKIDGAKVEEALKSLPAGASVQPKIDGAAAFIQLLKNRIEVQSLRNDKSGRPIVHTERFFGGSSPATTIPPELVGTVLRGELYGQMDGSGGGRAAGGVAGRDGAGDRGNSRGGGQGLGGSGAVAGEPVPADHAAGVGEPAAGLNARLVIPPQTLGGILNATVENSLKAQRERGIQLRTGLFDIHQLGNQPVDHAQTPYAQRRQMLEQVLQHLPQDRFHLFDQATTPDDALKLWQQIQSGQHPQTEEGVVIHYPTGVPHKAKLLEDTDVHLVGVFPGEGKYLGRGVGGFTYARSPGGPEVGRVGSGISDDTRLDAFQHPEAYIGRVAKLRSQGAFPAGALRSPVYLGLHEDPDMIAKQADYATEVKPAPESAFRYPADLARWFLNKVYSPAAASELALRRDDQLTDLAAGPASKPLVTADTPQTRWNPEVFNIASKVVPPGSFKLSRTAAVPYVENTQPEPTMRVPMETSPSSIQHEAGHVRQLQQDPAMFSRQVAGQTPQQFELLSGRLSGAAARESYNPLGLAAGFLQAAMHTGRVYNELAASHYGGMGATNGKPLSNLPAYLKPFKGVPSYLNEAYTPLLQAAGGTTVNNAVLGAKNLHGLSPSKAFQNTPGMHFLHQMGREKAGSEERPMYEATTLFVNAATLRDLQKFADLMPGGAGDDKPDGDFDKQELAKGTKHELEHTVDPRLAKETAKDHIVEHPHYYEALAKMETRLEASEEAEKQAWARIMAMVRNTA